MRVLPSAPVTCFVCGSTFTVQNRIEMNGRERTVHQQPSSCPFCDAPLLNIPALDVGIAKGLLLTHAGAPEEKKAYGTVARFLERFTRTEAEVDSLLKLARDLDFDAWEALDQRLLEHDKNASLKRELKYIPKLREAAREGDLFDQLQRAAAPVKDAHRVRSNHHMAIFRQRRPS
ncbi:MAG: hypothetical protein HOV81_16675 [Kofleriaceae bacterium]|nr:hypothetical protein [Kofleriaceae bacterium]